jgi:hypothetical protein
VAQGDAAPVAAGVVAGLAFAASGGVVEGGEADWAVVGHVWWAKRNAGNDCSPPALFDS